MARQRLTAFASTVAVLFFLATSASSQCTTRWVQQIYYFPDTMPAGAVCGPGQGPYSLLCSVPTTNCPPPLVWCPTCGKFVPAAGAPINLTNGNTYIQQTDVRLPGLGGGLMLSRTWNSIWPVGQAGQTGIFGSDWRSTYDERVFAGSGSATNYMVYAREDGGYWYFSGSGSTWNLASPASEIATLVQSGSTWTLTFKNGEKRTFNSSSGSLTSVIDRNGNAKQLTYDGQNRLIAVSDPAARHLYFNYPDGSSRLVSSVTSDFGVTVSYLYDSQGRLQQVTRPDQSTVSFSYDSQSLITAVTDSQGKILESHTYDSARRGLSSSRADGVEAVTVSYPN